jgi:NAD(P)-dependent dehydrogenase (short-subunit alcohol dehydrogenase family)
VTSAKLFLTVRDLAKAEETLSDNLLPGQIELLHLDLTSLASVRSCANEFLEKSQGTLNILICNAGVMRVLALIKIVDGFKTQFGTNHLGHVLLFQLLKPALLSSATPGTAPSVVTVSSSAHRYSEIQFGNLNFENNDYDSAKAYGQSKTANIYMANSIERHYSELGMHGLGLHPRVIFTGLYKYIDSQSSALLEGDEFKSVMKSSKQGAATTVFAAVAKELEGKGGVYLENCTISRSHLGRSLCDNNLLNMPQKNLCLKEKYCS